MNIIHSGEITEAIKEMCIEANLKLSSDMQEVFEEAVEKEESVVGKRILGQLEENLSKKNRSPSARIQGWRWCF